MQLYCMTRYVVHLGLQQIRAIKTDLLSMIPCVNGTSSVKNSDLGLIIGSLCQTRFSEYF